MLDRNGLFPKNFQRCQYPIFSSFKSKSLFTIMNQKGIIILVHQNSLKKEDKSNANQYKLEYLV